MKRQNKHVLIMYGSLFREDFFYKAESVSNDKENYSAASATEAGQLKVPSEIRLWSSKASRKHTEIVSDADENDISHSAICWPVVQIYQKFILLPMLQLLAEYFTEWVS